MKINGINGVMPKLKGLEEIAKPDDGKFGNVFSDMIKQVNSDQMESKALTNEFIAGGDVELHEVMVAGQKAKTSLDLLMEIRNKTVDMYKELTRIQ